MHNSSGISKICLVLHEMLLKHCQTRNIYQAYQQALHSFKSFVVIGHNVMSFPIVFIQPSVGTNIKH